MKTHFLPPGKGEFPIFFYIPCGEKTTSSRREKGLIILFLFLCLFLCLCLGNERAVS